MLLELQTKFKRRSGRSKSSARNHRTNVKNSVILTILETIIVFVLEEYRPLAFLLRIVVAAETVQLVTVRRGVPSGLRTPNEGVTDAHDDHHRQGVQFKIIRTEIMHTVFLSESATSNDANSANHLHGTKSLPHKWPKINKNAGPKSFLGVVDRAG